MALAMAAMLAVASAAAQGHGGGGPGGGGPGGGGGMGGFGGHGGFSRDGGPFRGGDASPMSARPGGVPHSGFQVGPPGRWWDDRKFAKGLGIESDQKKRMDAIFESDKGELSSRLGNLKREESALGKLTRAKEPDEAAIMAQIDRVAQSRAELEKSAAKMLLSIRRELTPEQVKKLNDQQDAQNAPPPPE